jgi:hypothetical protein
MGPEKGRSFGMPVDKFTDLALEGLVAGRDQIVIGNLAGAAGSMFQEVVDKRRKVFEDLAEVLRAH